MKPILSALSLFLMAMPGEAALHYTNFENQTIPSDSYGIYINPLSGAVSPMVPLDIKTGPWINLLFGGTAIGNTSSITLVITAAASGNGDGLILKLPGAAEIGPTMNFTVGANGSENHTGSRAGQFTPGEPAYIGFATAVTESYGWLCITVNDIGAGILHGAAYNDTSGATISAGAVPEPAMPALLLMTAAVLALRRRRSSCGNSPPVTHFVKIID